MYQARQRYYLAAPTIATPPPVDIGQLTKTTMIKRAEFMVYILRDSDQQPIYVGQSTNLFTRLARHMQGPCKRARTAMVETIPCESKAQMDALEAALIKLHQPEFNTRGL
jgi:predicted GIY-YIG superfamily endonuclease